MLWLRNYEVAFHSYIMAVYNRSTVRYVLCLLSAGYTYHDSFIHKFPERMMQNSSFILHLVFIGQSSAPFYSQVTLTKRTV